MPVYINEITIRNFRSINEAKLKLKPGINVLVGANGSGKTNILLALSQLGYILSFTKSKKYLAKPVAYEVRGTVDHIPFTYYLSVYGNGYLHVITEELSLGGLYIVNNGGKLNINNETIDPNTPLMSALAYRYEDSTLLVLPNKVIKIKDPTLVELVNNMFKNVKSLGVDSQQCVEPISRYIFFHKDELNELLKPLDIEITSVIDNTVYTDRILSAGMKKLIQLYALTYESQIVLIDELENSLHLDYIQRFIDYVKTLKDTYVIATTHSPLVIDNVDLEDILLVKKEKDGTKVSSIENVEEFRKKLEELKITQSEAILYGN